MYRHICSLATAVSLFIFTVAVSACSSGSGPTDEQQAASAAKDYYDALIYGQPEQWVSSHCGASRMSGQYRQLLLENALMFLDQQRQAHGGITEVSVGDLRGEYVDSCIIALLTLSFADASRETVAVPMVRESDGVWKMK